MEASKFIKRHTDKAITPGSLCRNRCCKPLFRHLLTLWILHSALHLPLCISYPFLFPLFFLLFLPLLLPPCTYTHVSNLLEETASSFGQTRCFKGRGASQQPQLFTFLLAFSFLVPDQFPQSAAITITHNWPNPSATCIFVQRFVAHRFKFSRFLRSIHRRIAPGDFFPCLSAS